MDRRAEKVVKPPENAQADEVHDRLLKPFQHANVPMRLIWEIHHLLKDTFALFVTVEEVYEVEAIRFDFHLSRQHWMSFHLPEKWNFLREIPSTVEVEAVAVKHTCSKSSIRPAQLKE